MYFLCGWSGIPTVGAQAAALVQEMAGRGGAAAASPGQLECGTLHAVSGCGVEIAASDELCVAIAGRPLWRGSTAAVRAAELAASFRDRGRAALAELSGRYAVAIQEPAARRLLLATDRFGTVPLYIAVSGDGLGFATHPAALHALPGMTREVDPQAVYDYVFFHCIPSPRSVYRGISKLKPAEALCWEAGRVQRAYYWEPQFATGAGNVAAQGEALVAALESAVARAAGGPDLGAFLSGGLDSSSVAGMLKRVTGSAATFTIGFDAAGYDESAYARIAAGHFGTRHHEYRVTPADVASSLPRITAHCMEPFGNSSVLPSYHCAKFARDNGVSCLLAGDGGDELFAGNTRYVTQRVFERYFTLPAVLRATLEQTYRVLPFLRQLPVAGKGHRYIEQALMRLPDRLQSYNFLNRFDPASVFAADWLGQIDREAPWRAWRERYAEPRSGTSLHHMLYLDWKFTLADNDLVKVGSMCDLAGVEVRYPMLDDAVVDLSLGLSEAVLLPHGQLRGFYKQAFRDFLPREILEKSKHGFGLPFGVWLREHAPLRELAADALAKLARRAIFRPEFLARAQEMHRGDAPGYYGELVWIMLVLELWLEARAL